MADDELGGYVEPPATGSEESTLLGSRERQRATFEWKCAGLSRAELSTRIAASELTLGRLLKHLAYMEDLNFTRDVAGADLPEPWAGVDPTTRSEWALVSADDDEPGVLYGLWHDAVGRSRVAVLAAMARDGAGGTFLSGGETSTLRRLLVDMIKEYGRHTGHADLLREAIDGRVGEDPPGPARPFTLPA